MDKLDLNMKEVHKELVDFLRENFKKNGFSKAVLGLSGGIDSALAAYLLRDALGKENVLAIMMPYKSSNPDSLNHAKLVVEDLGINSKVIEITDMIDAYFKNEKDPTSLRMGNKMARERMSILYDYSSKENALVVGTSNKTEIYLGYSTQFGDSACALNPIGDLYKTNVWELSRYLNIPKELIEKKPSADLWEGQTDEQEMGLTYKEADQVLYRMLEENKTVEEILNEGFDKSLVENIVRRMNRSEYKRRMPLIAKIKRQVPMQNQLKEDLNDFLKEKEELREVIGKIGGSNNSQAKIITSLFMGIVLVIFVTGIILKQLSPMTTLLLLLLIISFKIIWMLQQMQKSMHFQFWVLNSIEIRINELDKRQKKIEKILEGLEDKKEE